MSTYTPKGWIDYPNLTTPTNATAWKAMEQRVVSYGTAEAISPGADSYESFRVKQRALGANMSVDVGLAATENMVYVRDAANGIYRYEYNGAQLNAVIAAADLTNPRVDRVCATAPVSVDSIVPQVIVLTGTPTAGATANNLSGAQAVPAGYELLADVEVAAAAGTVVTGNIRDRRRVGGQFGDSSVTPYGSNLPSGTPRDEVVVMPSRAIPVLSQTLTPTTHDNFQGVYLGALSRRIVGANRVRFRYAQGATPATSNFNIALVDISGRVIVATGAVAFAGIANSFQSPALVITAQTFEAGELFVWMGVAALTAASAVSFYGVQGNGTVTAPGPNQIGQRFSNAAGGTVFPATNTVATYTDVAGAGVVAAYTAIPLPIISLSVG